ncbi:hypothetical protein AVEN_43288-1 [Araneus ventricosus]|uniref:Uncharacterized protein n=1 Tax=Araneus ventricosus TaxID=182803 RepID=A0A4Y2GEQ4_ARAVE|nr:hypothetical protein AVEN_43288-1 [Araneus ventricosus]
MDLANFHGVRKRLFYQNSDSAIPHHGLAIGVFTSPLSSLRLRSSNLILYLHPRFSPSSHLKPYLPALRGVAEQLNLNDLSGCRTNHPTTNIRFNPG